MCIRKKNRSGNGAAPPAGKGTARAPGMYLSIAYLVALGIIVATVVILRVVLFRNTSAQRRSVRKVQRGFFGRASNKVCGCISVAVAMRVAVAAAVAVGCRCRWWCR